MELTRSQELIKQLKEIKEAHEITYPRIIERMEKNGKYVSLTTLRRVFAEGSEANASNFNYESTLLPIAEALLINMALHLIFTRKRISISMRLRGQFQRTDRRQVLQW